MKMITEIVVLIMGLFFVIDSLFIHAITFDYGKLGIAFIDPFFSHLGLGLILIGLAIWDIKVSKK